MDICGERRLDNREEDTTDADQERHSSSPPPPTSSSLAGKSFACHADQQQQQIHQGFIPFTEYVKQRLFGDRQDGGNDYESGDDDDDDGDDSSVGQDKRRRRRRLEPGSNSSAKNEDENDGEDESIGLSSSSPSSEQQQQQEQRDQQIRGSDTPSDVTPSRHTNILRSTTLHLLQTYRRCSTEFAYEPKAQRICLTKPSEPSIDNKWDNEEGNLIMYLNDMLLDRYVVKELLGQGTFGQVVRCEDLQQGTQVAIKVIKNKRAYLRQALTERHILRELNGRWDPNDENHIVRMLDHFNFNNHLCIVFELLSINLFELIKQNKFQGLSLQVIRVFLMQLLSALSVLYEARIIHCDLKPENILLNDLSSIKLIDFGSACFENETIYTYIQSRFYRAPEIILGFQYDMSIDTWSLGCILAELFLGIPLFPGVSQYNQICRIVEMLGFPPVHLIESGRFSHRYFKPRQTPLPEDHEFEEDEEECRIARRKYDLKTEEEYCQETKTTPKGWKRYFNYTKLHDLIKFYSYKNVTDRSREDSQRRAFADLLLGLLQWDPMERWTVTQIKEHPFVTAIPFDFSVHRTFEPNPDQRREEVKRILREQQRMMAMQQQQQTQYRETIMSHMGTLGRQRASSGAPFPHMQAIPPNMSGGSWYSGMSQGLPLGQSPSSAMLSPNMAPNLLGSTPGSNNSFMGLMSYGPASGHNNVSSNPITISKSDDRIGDEGSDVGRNSGPSSARTIPIPSHQMQRERHQQMYSGQQYQQNAGMFGTPGSWFGDPNSPGQVQNMFLGPSPSTQQSWFPHQHQQQQQSSSHSIGSSHVSPIISPMMGPHQSPVPRDYQYQQQHPHHHQQLHYRPPPLHHYHHHYHQQHQHQQHGFMHSPHHQQPYYQHRYNQGSQFPPDRFRARSNTWHAPHNAPVTHNTTNRVIDHSAEDGEASNLAHQKISHRSRPPRGTNVGSRRSSRPPKPRLNIGKESNNVSSINTATAGHTGKQKSSRRHARIRASPTDSSGTSSFDSDRSPVAELGESFDDWNPFPNSGDLLSEEHPQQQRQQLQPHRPQMHINHHQQRLGGRMPSPRNSTTHSGYNTSPGEHIQQGPFELYGLSPSVSTSYMQNWTVGKRPSTHTTQPRNPKHSDNNSHIT